MSVQVRSCFLLLTCIRYLGHSNIIKYSNRPFLNAEEKVLLEIERQDSRKKLRVSQESTDRMDDCLIDNINAIVGKDDELWHLGDFCMAGNFNFAKKYRDRIKCKNVHEIWGNHDNYAIRPLFTTASDLHTVRHNGQEIVLLHYAMVAFNKAHHGAIHLYGHSHSSLEPWMDEHMPGRRSMDVGVDNAVKILGQYRPFSFEEIMNLMKDKKGWSMDHHK